MHIKAAVWRSILWLSVLDVGVATAAEAVSTPPIASAAVHELSGPSNRGLDARNWRLDPAVFTEITPFTAPDIAIKLPPDQQDEQPSEPVGQQPAGRAPERLAAPAQN